MKKNILLVLVTIVLPFICISQDNKNNPSSNDDPGHLKCISGNCVNGTGTAEFMADTLPATYKRSFKNSTFNGKGTLVVKDQFTYTGDFKDGIYEGSGVMKFTNGDVYTGQVHKGMAQGSGTMVFANGKRSTGIWKENKLWSGTGFLDFGNGESYYGGVKENMANGNGVYSTEKGAKITGHFINGLIEGKANMVYADGSSYDGNFKKEGYGIEHFKDGYIYKGNFSEDQRNGQGIMYNNKAVVDYSGEWVNEDMKYPEKALSYKDRVSNEIQKLFHRVIFKGWQTVIINDEKGTATITDEYNMKPDNSFEGTDEYVLKYQGKDYRTKQKIFGEFDPVSNKIHIHTGATLYEDKNDDVSWIRGAAEATVFENSDHPGYYIIRGKDISGNDFEESDY